MNRSAARHTLATALLLGTGLLAAACGSVAGSSGAGGGPASPRAHHSHAPAASPAAVSSSPATTAQTTGCLTAGLTAKVSTSQAGAAAGSAYYPIDFTNVSGHTCTLFGYPGVSFTTGRGGSQIGQPASRSQTRPAAMVTLAPGAVAHATLQVAVAGNFPSAQCKPVTAHWLKIFPPNDFKPLYVPFTTQACSGQSMPGGHQLTIYVMRSGAGKRGQAP